ncbi:alpha/beta hydrolase [Prauserella cavernicola]|uniref:Alpha/beta fold hydrolase n=1 Tax=Prauserella cavernicola TaxID=2800127 RepID=A0A934QVI9_9PSEU|nr:alpha/beta hydrolase [Prauserella cavernicola]MBK1787141.1 alpha/beta fold hydrolase [Prauserella cavernicola]
MQRRSIPMALAAVGLPLLLVATACGQPDPAGEPEATASSAPDLTQFHDQQLTFEPCAPYATTAADEALFANDRFDCARMQVPLDYDDPDGPRAEIALLRMKAKGERIGSLVVNPGGPGGSGMSHTATMAPTWDPMAIGERFDIVGFDPRGVGATTPRVDCFTNAEDDRGEGFNGTLLPEDVPDAQAAEEIAQRCADSAGGEQALVNIGTRDTVQDLDVLRAALGDEQLSFLGYSYGTELGAVYAESFPDNVRAMLLDGAVDPELSDAEFTVSQAVGIQGAFDAMAAQCASTPDCPLGTDPARAVEAYHALLRPLQDNPLPTTDGRGLTYESAATGVFSGLYSEKLFPVVLRGLTEAADGRGDLLLALHDQYAQRGSDGRHGSLIEAFRSIRCMDWERRTPADQADLLRQVREASPIMDDGNPVSESYHECAAWPEPPSRTGPFITGDVDVPPILVTSVTDDPATPHQGGINMARILDGTLLTVDGAQHGAALLGQSPCVDQIATDYLIDLTLPPAEARCDL